MLRDDASTPSEPRDHHPLPSALETRPTLPPSEAAEPPVLGNAFRTVADMAIAVDAIFLVTATDERYALSIAGESVTDTVVIFKEALKGQQLVRRTLSDDGTLKVRQTAITPLLEAGRRYVVYLDLDDGRPFEPSYPAGLYGEVEAFVADMPWVNLFPQAGGEPSRLLRELEQTAAVGTAATEG